jgi:hypothetical protein
MSDVDPEGVFWLVHQDLPPDLHPHVIIVGSLAAAYHFRDRLGTRTVKTKDADIMVQPAGALEKCRDIANRLLDGGWRPIEECVPGDASTLTEKLPAVRFHPPNSELYFLELTGLPSRVQQEVVFWDRFEARGGWYALPSYRYLGLVEFDRQRASVGLEYASPAMMALANALSHRTADSPVMSKPIEGRSIRRAAKDLGRVLAIAHLAGRDETEAWLPLWRDGLRKRFPDDEPALARAAGDGIRALLADRAAFEQAYFTTRVGLLGGLAVTEDNLRATGDRLLIDVFRPLADAFTE